MVIDQNGGGGGGEGGGRRRRLGACFHNTRVAQEAGRGDTLALFVLSSSESSSCLFSFSSWSTPHHCSIAPSPLSEHPKHRITITMVELRKRKLAPPPPAPAKKRAPSKSKKDKEKDAPQVKESSEDASAPAAKEEAPAASKAGGAPKVGDTIDLEDFGGEVQTHSEEATTVSKLVGASKAGLVLFTYPKASTPGCKYGFEAATEFVHGVVSSEG